MWSQIYLRALVPVRCPKTNQRAHLGSFATTNMPQAAHCHPSSVLRMYCSPMRASRE
jgi:hypothetical protein